MKEKDKLVKKLNPSLKDYPQYDIKVLRVINKNMKGITKEQVDYFIKRIKRMGFSYVCFGNLCNNLYYISDVIKCGIYEGLDEKVETWRGPWQNVWKQVYEEEGVYIVTQAAEYKELVKVIWDWENGKIYKYDI